MAHENIVVEAECANEALQDAGSIAIDKLT